MNWWVHAAEAAAGRTSKTSSRTTKEPTEPETPGGAPPRERVNMKKVITSIMIVEVEVVATARAVVNIVGVVVTRAVVKRVGVARTFAAREVEEDEDTDATEAVELAILTAIAVADEATDVAVTDVATELVDAVVLLLNVIVQLVAAPLPSSWHTTGWKGIADGGQVSCVNDMRYLSQRKVKRLFPTHASGVVVPVKTVSNPLRNAGATETMSWQ